MIDTIMDANTTYPMNGLISDPDVIRWFIWSWRSDTRHTSWETMSKLLHCMAHTPLDITITNDTLSIFKGTPVKILTSPPTVKKYFTELQSNKSKYFHQIVHNHVFRNIECSKFKLNHVLENMIDRAGWITWTIYWMIKFQPSRFFVMKDILQVSLLHIPPVQFHTTESLPSPPWTRTKHANIQTIYKELTQSIYYACFGF